MKWLLLAFAIGSEISAALALRASEGLRVRRWAPIVVIGYVAAFGFLAGALSAGMPVGVAYGTWAAIGIALTAVLARFLFKEPFSRITGIGVGLIAAGVLLVELGAQVS